MNTALTRRPSLWADEPVMADGKVFDAMQKALTNGVDAQADLLNAMTSSLPDLWLRDAEKRVGELLERIRFMRAELNRVMS